MFSADGQITCLVQENFCTPAFWEAYVPEKLSIWDGLLVRRFWHKVRILVLSEWYLTDDSSPRRRPSLPSIYRKSPKPIVFLRYGGWLLVLLWWTLTMISLWSSLMRRLIEIKLWRIRDYEWYLIIVYQFKHGILFSISSKAKIMENIVQVRFSSLNLYSFVMNVFYLL